MENEQAGSGGQRARRRRCRAKILGTSNLVECQADIQVCEWQIPYGKGKLCSHMANQMIARGIIPAAWLPQAPSDSP